jgi:hypothetical protein
VSTILDVLMNFCDGDLSYAAAERLSDARIEELGVEVNRFYDNWTPPPEPAPGDGARPFRAYAGSWLNSGRIGKRREMSLSHLLYADSVVIHDPMARYFDPEAGRVPAPKVNAPGVDLTRQLVGPGMDNLSYGHYSPDHDILWTRVFLEETLPAYRALAPLIEEGLVLPVPQRRIARRHGDEILAAIEDDLTDERLAALLDSDDGAHPLITESARGQLLTLPEGLDPAVADRLRVVGPANMLNRELAIAREMGARYVPSDAVDWRLLELRLRRTGETLGLADDISVVTLPAVAAGVVPLVSTLDTKTVVDIRKNEDAFASWRAELRSVVRTLEAGPDDPDAFAKEAQGAIEDHLTPQILEVKRARSRSTVLKSATANVGTIAVTGALSAGAVALTGGDPSGTLLGPAAAAAVALVKGAIFRPSLQGTKAVVARLTDG